MISKTEQKSPGKIQSIFIIIKFFIKVGLERNFYNLKNYVFKNRQKQRILYLMMKY